MLTNNQLESYYGQVAVASKWVPPENGFEPDYRVADILRTVRECFDRSTITMEATFRGGVKQNIDHAAILAERDAPCIATNTPTPVPQGPPTGDRLCETPNILVPALLGALAGAADTYLYCKR